MRLKTLDIIIPVFNEKKTVGEILQNVNNLNLPGWQKRIIAVDDASTDSSRAKILAFQKKYRPQNFLFLAHEKNLGKGAAIQTATKHLKGDAAIIQDADLEYDPKDIKKLLDEFSKSKNTADFGTRKLRERKTPYRHYVLGANFLTLLVNLLFKTKLTDVYTGYKLMGTKTLKSLNLKSRGFEIEMEITAKLLKTGIKIKEVNINYNPRTFKEGKKIKLTDGVRGLWTLIKTASLLKSVL